MASFARRAAPAAALGTLALVIVGIADPAIAKFVHGDDEADAISADPAVAAAGQSAPSQPRNVTPEAPSASVPEPADPPATQEPAPASVCASGEQVTGVAASTPWGPVQVVAIIDGGQLCAVQAVTWPDRDRKSAMINSYAIPELDAMASELGTQFDYISGATYTSEAYRSSLQSILDGA